MTSNDVGGPDNEQSAEAKVPGFGEQAALTDEGYVAPPQPRAVGAVAVGAAQLEKEELGGPGLGEVRAL